MIMLICRNLPNRTVGQPVCETNASDASSEKQSRAGRRWSRSVAAMMNRVPADDPSQSGGTLPFAEFVNRPIIPSDRAAAGP